MDVKGGHCWRCNVKLRGGIVSCDSCKIAQYCSAKCCKDDQLRHNSVECPTWSTKKCGTCNKSGAKYECADCFTVHYCSTDCQKKNWSQHKLICRVWKHRVKQAATRENVYPQEPPFYFSNSFANDLLNLDNNEMKSIHVSKNATKEATGNFSILIPAFSDLCQMIQTVYSLPANFKGNLKFVLNNIDPFVVARNVLLLYMISSSTEDTAPMISSIWLSLLLSEDENFLLRESLISLIQMDSSQLRDRTRGVLDVSTTSYQSLRAVWLGWVKYIDMKGKNLAMWIKQQRKLMFDTNSLAAGSFKGYIELVPQRHAPSIRKWLEDGIVTTRAQRNKKLPFGNPTFTGRPRGISMLPGKPIPDIPFVYCIRSDCIAFQMWDYLDMIQRVDCDSVTEMCHAFTTLCVTMTTDMMKGNRLVVQTFVENFLNIESCLLADNQKFDRIFASNVIDIHPVGKVIKTLEPFLNKDNPHAVLLTETHDWHVEMEGADYPVDNESPRKLLLLATRDIDPTMRRFSSMKELRNSFIHEYYNNTDYFISYLRGRKLAESIHQTSPEDGQAKSKLPKWKDVKNWGGLHLRDIRVGRNKVVPFCRRVNARAVNMVRGSARIIEWYHMEA